MLDEARVLVATRPLATTSRYVPGGLLPALGVRSPDSETLVDLDTDRYFDEHGLRGHIVSLLTQEGVESPKPPTAAWQQYRANPMLLERVAGVIAARADRNYLVAALAAVPLGQDPRPLDIGAATLDPRSIPSGVGEALTKYLARLPEHRERARAVC